MELDTIFGMRSKFGLLYTFIDFNLLSFFFIVELSFRIPNNINVESKRAFLKTSLVKYFTEKVKKYGWLSVMGPMTFKDPYLMLVDGI